MATDIRLKEGLPEITEALVATYTECSHINHLGHKPLPSREAVVDILADLLRDPLPRLRPAAEPAHRQRRVPRRRPDRRPARQADPADRPRPAARACATRGAAHRLRGAGPAEGDRAPEPAAGPPRRRSNRTCEAAFDGDPAAKSHHEIIFCYPGLEAITVYRIAHELLLLGVPLIPRMMTEYAHSKTGIDIHPGATHRPGLLHRPRHRRRHRRDVRHRHERQALPGRDARRPVASRATTTGNIIRGMKRHPTLEDDVVIYANATILGGDTVIGHHVGDRLQRLADALRGPAHRRRAGKAGAAPQGRFQAGRSLDVPRLAI